MSALISDPNLAMSQAASQDLQAARNRVQSLGGGLSEEEKQAQMREACEGFEAIFIQNMWEQMRASLPEDGLLHSKEEKFWQGMYDEELAKSMASSGGIGLADMMMDQLTRTDRSMSEAASNSARRGISMPVEPAPILPQSAMEPVLAQTAQVQTAQAGASVNSIYDSEWVQPEAPEAPDQIAGLESVETQASPQASNLISQTLDDLAELALAEQLQVLNNAQAELETMYADLASVQAQVAATSPDRPGSILAQVPPLSELGANLAEQEPAAAQVVNFTYQTNLPPGQRQASPLSSGSEAAALYQPLVSEATNLSQSTVGVQTVAEASLVVEAQSSLPSATQAPVEQVLPESLANPAVLVGNQMDLLAGISPRFIPSRLLAPVTASAVAQAGLDNVAELGNPAGQGVTQAGGQRLRGPEPVSQDLALGNPAPSLAGAGSFAAPVDGEISSGFGWRLDPFTGQRAWHAGVDIKAAYGEDVRVVMDGKVIFAGEDPELGNLIVVEHADNLRTYYGHNAELNVQVGDLVREGTNIAQAGSSGRAAGTHVHFELRRGDLALNPEPLLAQGRTYYAALAD